MANSTKKNTSRVATITKPQLSIDWTTTAGLTPFFVQPTGSEPGYYSVAVETDVSKKTTDFNPDNYKEAGVEKILKHHCKNSEDNRQKTLEIANIPVNASGTYVPIRPTEKIKVLVRVPDQYLSGSSRFKFEDLPMEQKRKPSPWDEIQLNTFELSKKSEKIVNALKTYAREVDNFEGKVYNVDLKKEASRIANFVPTLSELVENNGFTFDETKSDLIMIGISGSGPESSEYRPIYVEINQGEEFKHLICRFDEFRDSDFTTSNTMYLYKHFSTFVSASNQGAVICEPVSDPDIDWEAFLKEYIHFPSAVIEHTKGRPKSPEPNEELERQIREADTDSIKSPDTLDQENWRVASQEFKKLADEKKKEAKDFVGDTVLANMEDTLHKINKLESMYDHLLDKLGIKYIIRAAMKCLAIDLPIEEIKDFLRQINAFLGDILAILEIPTITLDDLIPTVDIMSGIAEQLIMAVAEAVKKALTDMVKQIIIELLENCGDVSKASFGGVPIGEAFKNGGVGGLVDATSGILGDAALGGALAGVKTGLRQTGAMPANAKKFLLNLNTFISNDTLQQLTSENFAAVGQIIDQVSAVLTPGELSRVLRGQAPDSVVRIIKNVAESYAGSQEAPPSAEIVKDLLASPEKINDFFLNVAKVIDEPAILKQIEEFDKFTPGLTDGLCDKDDSILRAGLLSDKGLGPYEIQDQIDASRDRARKRIGELSDLLSKDNILEGAIPPIYCTFKDGKIQQGLVNKDHESFSFMMKTVLGTTFDGVENTFGQDLSRVPELLKIEAPGGTTPIERTMLSNAQGAVFAGGAWRIMNPAFEMAVKQGYQPHPPYVKIDPATAHLVESSGLIDTLVGEGNLFADSNEQGEARLWAHQKTIETQYPLPPLQKPITKNIFMPGLAQSYENFQINIAHGDPAQNDKARTLLNVDRRILQISIENQLKGLLQQYGGNNSLFQALALEQATNAELRINLGVDRYTLQSAQFSNAPEGKDKYSILIKADDELIYNHLYTVDIPEKAMNVINSRQLKADFSTMDTSPKEKYFTNFLQNIWAQGEDIYLSDPKTPITKPSYMRDFYSHSNNAVANALMQNQDPNQDINSLFEEYWRDMMATCLEMTGRGNKLLDQFGTVFSLLDFNPAPTPACPNPSLLGVEGIKQEVLNIYDRVKCIERSLPNVSGLGNNRNNAFEQAALYGVIKATVRTYVIEIVVKCLITFSRLMFEKADEAFIGYIRDRIIKGVDAQGYLDIFMEETLKAYNNGPALATVDRVDSNVALDWFIKEELGYAINLFLSLIDTPRGNIDIGTLLVNPVSMEHGEIPEFDVVGNPISPLAPERSFQRVDADLKDYRVSDPERIRGIRDWRNGNFYLERYIRADIDYSSLSAQNRFGFSTIQLDPKDSTYIGPTPVTDNGVFEGVTNYELFGGWFRRIFSAPKQIQHKLPNLESPPETECAPEGVIEITAPTQEDVDKLRLYYKNIRYGLRLVCQVTEDKGNSEGIFDNEVFKTARGLQVLQNADLTKAKLNKSYYIKERVANEQKNVESFAFPIVCVEQDVSLDTPIQEILDDTDFFNNGYRTAYRGLVNKLKKTDEWSFIFDYCFPTDRLVSLTALYNIAFLEPFPGLDAVFTNTKEQLRMAFVSLVQSGNYQFNDLDWTNKGMSQAALNQRLPGFDIAKMALMFLTALLKGAGESFSPNIAIAKKIKDVSDIAAKKAVGLVEDISERLSDPKPPPKCPPGEIDIDIPILPISLALLPVDLFPPPPFGPGIGPPLGPLGYMYLAGFGLPDLPPAALLKSEDEKEVDRCNEKNKSGGADLTKKDCPPSGGPVKPKKG